MVVDNSYGNKTKDNTRLIKNKTIEFLEYADRVIVKADAKSYDATLMIRIEGGALGARYSDGGYYYMWICSITDASKPRL